MKIRLNGKTWESISLREYTRLKETLAKTAIFKDWFYDDKLYFKLIEVKHEEPNHHS